MFLYLILNQIAKGEQWLRYVFAKVYHVRFYEVDHVSVPVDIGLLRALNAIAEYNSEFSLNEHTGTVLFVVFISILAWVNSEHISFQTHNLR